MRQNTQQGVHISHSQVQEFTQCPRKYHLHRRLEVPPDFMPSALLFGIALHETLALFHQRRLEGRAVSLEELHNTFLGHWEAEELPVKYSRRENEEALIGVAKRMVEVYVDDPGCCGEVLGVEEPFRVDLSPKLPPIHGRIDLVEKSANDQLVVTDFKTSKNGNKPASDQLVVYRRAVTDLGFPANSAVQCRYVVLTKTAEPEIKVFEVDVTAEDVVKLVSRYEQVWQAIQGGSSYPRTGWWCKGCQWARHCDAANGGETDSLF